MAKMLRMSSSMTSTFMPASEPTGTPPAGIGSATGHVGDGGQRRHVVQHRGAVEDRRHVAERGDHRGR